MLTLTDFSIQRPEYEIAQGRALDWLTEVHAASQATLQSLTPEEQRAFAAQWAKVVQRCACGPDKIGRRGHVLSDIGSTDWEKLSVYDVIRHPRGAGTALRSSLFGKIVSEYFTAAYADVIVAPSDLIHVTCTGYVSPSGAQRLVASKGWGNATTVTHAYHMGCYAAFPAIRLAIGSLCAPGAAPPREARRVDIVHTELCTLHLDPSDHTMEQCVVQSLFADGFIRYSLRETDAPGLEVLSLSEAILPDSSDSMGWSVSDFGMYMTLARDVPERIAGALRPFVLGLYRKAGLDCAMQLPRTVFAVHPGGPKIIDRVREVLELSEAQIQTSRAVLFDCGNMSSATLPHVWSRLLADPNVSEQTLVLSLAFGPGLTVCGGLFRKH